ncbi:MAG: hypothetical protein ACKOWK_00565 [Micrococcales bacterium]
MTDNEWQTRVLTDEEVQSLLANLGPLEGMAVLQRQFELRSQEANEAIQTHQAKVAPVPVDVPAVQTHPSEAIQSQPTETAAASDSDIVNNLNALFASRTAPSVKTEEVAQESLSDKLTSSPAEEPSSGPSAQSVAEPASAIAETQVDPGFAPRHLESDTRSQFIPTFSNPLPGTESVVIVTPMLEGQQSSVREASPEPPAPEGPAPQDLVPEAVTIPEPAEVAVQQGLDSNPEPTASTATEPAFAAEEAVLDFEEHHRGNENIVDLAILNAGGEDDAILDLVQEPAEQNVAQVVEAPATGKSGVWDLLANWNGTGSLLFLAAVGFVAASNGYSLTSILTGAFSALAIAGFGFGTAALAARRSRQPQSTTSRAAFGVRGAAIPLVFIIIARFAATGIATVGTALALKWFVPALGNQIHAGGFYLDGLSAAIVALLAIATLLTILGTVAHLAVTRFVSIVSIVGLVGIGAFAYLADPASISRFGALDSGHALAVASVVIIFVSVVWGTTATDETPNLRSRLAGPKLLAAGVLNFSILGSIAVCAGYLFAGANFGPQLSTTVLALFALLTTFALSHQIKRSADSFSGFGLQKTRWWVVLLSSLFVSIAALSAHLLVDERLLTSSALSLLPVAGVPVVAWLAIFGMDTVLRTDDYHEVSLLRNYGFYGKLRLVNTLGWLLAVAAGFGFLDSAVPGFSWLGYIAKPLGLSLTGLQADMGVWIAFLIGVVSPLFTITAIRDQEAEGRALRARHTELLNIAGEN